MSKVYKMMNGGKLYIGNILTATNKEWLADKNIKVIINCANELPMINLGNDILYYKLLLNDIPQDNLLANIKNTNKLINNALKKNYNVLVHCAAGISRSASVIIYYLMTYHNMCYDHAYTYLKSVHPKTRPNTGYQQQLIKISPQCTR